MDEWCKVLAAHINEGKVVHVPGIDERKATSINGRLKFLKCYADFQPAYRTTNATYQCNEFGEIIDVQPGIRVLSGFTFSPQKKWSQSAP